MPLYLLGAMLNKNMIICIAKRFDHSSFQFLAIIFLCIYCVAAWFLPNGFEKVNIINCLLFTLFRLSTPFVMCVVIWFIIKNNIPDIRFMHYSFFVYCMHAPVITLTGIVYDRTLYMLFLWNDNCIHRQPSGSGQVPHNRSPANRSYAHAVPRKMSCNKNFS